MKFDNNLKYPKITIVTPNYNGAQFLEETILSVLEQNYPNLEYIIIDGGSNDRSLEIINKYSNQLFYWESKPDNSMYDAINKGFAKSSGDIMCWINSDDILWENALNYVVSIFRQNQHINWLQGYPSVIDEQSNLVYNRDPVFSKYYFYLNQHQESFRFIQQESTFWTRTLWERAGGFLNTDFTLASDFDLWMRFFEVDKIYCTKLKLGAFRMRKGQKSSDTNLYLMEAKRSLKMNYVQLRSSDKLHVHLLNRLININAKGNNKVINKLVTKLINNSIGKPNFVIVKQ